MRRHNLYFQVKKLADVSGNAWMSIRREEIPFLMILYSSYEGHLGNIVLCSGYHKEDNQDLGEN